MSTDYEKFVKVMEEKDAKLPSEKPHISIGMKDEKGNLLILGGWKADLWRLSSGLYTVGNDTTASMEQAMVLYNQYNNAKYQLDYIWKVFQLWYEKQFVIVANVPSRTNPNVTYAVRKSPDGKLSCECQGFMYRGECWHVEAVKELTNAKGK